MEILKHATVINNNINATDIYGQTPLYIACSRLDINNKTVSIIEALLKQPLITIYQKQNPFDIIQQKLVAIDDPSNWNNKNNIKHWLMKIRCFIHIVQLFNNYYIRKRWQIYCYVMKMNQICCVQKKKIKVIKNNKNDF